jgi:hypothetical protein
MTVEARITPIWKKQKLLLGLLMLGFGVWFLFDGLVGYPKSDERYRALEKLSADKSEWPALAKQHNIGRVPEKFLGPGKVIEQFVAAGVTGLLGLGILGYWFSQLKRTVRMDEEAVTSAAGVRVPFSAITGVGKKLWDKKGIAKIRYALDGKEGEFVVDDYKFDTKPSRQILEEIERRLMERHAK